jgi:sugar/nucleoside kinase (ribokinase family)
MCGTVAVKLGKKGAIIRSAGKTARVGAELVKAVDTTGAGDLWQAGFLYGFVNGRPLDVCGKYGSILGAEVVQVVGASIPDSRWPEIRKSIEG